MHRSQTVNSVSRPTVGEKSQIPLAERTTQRVPDSSFYSLLRVAIAVLSEVIVRKKFCYDTHNRIVRAKHIVECAESVYER